MKRRFIKESLSQSQLSTYFNQYKSMEESEKMGWIKAIRECIQELGYGSISRSDMIAGTFGIGLIVMGIKLNIPELCILGAGTIAALAHFEKDVWVKIIQCANNKRKETDTIPDEQMNESKMKKTIRLTESELINLVQKIIKEDEMMAMDSSMGPKVFTLAGLGIKEPAYMAYLKGTTPFYINGVEQKQNRIIQPNEKFSCKDCILELVGNKTKRSYTITFDNMGNAKLKK